MLMLLPFLSALSVSLITLMAAVEVQKKLQKVSKPRRIFVQSILASVTLLFASIAIYSIYQLVTSVSALAANQHLKEKFSGIMTPVKNYMTSFLSKFSSTSTASKMFDEKLTDLFSQSAEVLAAQTLKFISSLPDLLLLFAFVIIAFVLLKKYYNQIKFKILVHIPKGHMREKSLTLLKIAEISSYSAMVSTLSVAFAQGIVVSFGAGLAGLSNWSLYFVGSFFFSFFPVIGLLPIIIIGSIESYMTNGLTSFLIFLSIGMISTLADNLLRTLMMSKENENINSFLSFFCLIGAIYVFGLAGLILGPFLISFASNLLKESDLTSEDPEVKAQMELEKAKKSISKYFKIFSNKNW